MCVRVCLCIDPWCLSAAAPPDLSQPSSQCLLTSKPSPTCVLPRAWCSLASLRLKITLAKAPYVEDVTGFPVGTIPPLGHRTRVPTLVDAELLKYSTIVGGAGLR